MLTLTGDQLREILSTISALGSLAAPLIPGQLDDEVFKRLQILSMNKVATDGLAETWSVLFASAVTPATQMTVASAVPVISIWQCPTLEFDKMVPAATRAKIQAEVIKAGGRELDFQLLPPVIGVLASVVDWDKVALWIAQWVLARLGSRFTKGCST